MKATCPNSKDHKRFTTTAHVMEEWLVDEAGAFIEMLETLETDHGPDPGNTWTCDECGAKAEVE